MARIVKVWPLATTKARAGAALSCMGFFVPAPDYTSEIAQLEKLLNSGVKDTNADGQRTSFDLAAARTRLAELKRLTANTTARPVISTMNLSGAW